MADIVTLHNPSTNDTQYPVTMDSAVLTESGATVKESLGVMEDKVDEVVETMETMKAQSQLIFDVTYSDGSTGRISVYGSQA